MGEVSKEASCEMSPAKLKEKRIESFSILPLFFTFLLVGRCKCVCFCSAPFNMKCGGYSGVKIYDLCLFLYMGLNLGDVSCASLLTREGSRVSYPECMLLRVHWDKP